MSKRIPAVVVPGFWGFSRESDHLPGETGPAELLEALWLSFLEGLSESPGSYQLALPEQGMLVPELPPESSFEAIGAALANHLVEGALSCFVYDWRRDLLGTAAQLAQGLRDGAGREASAELDLIAIGPGAMVVRYLLESGAFPDVASRVRRTVLIGAPGVGIPAGLLLLNGLFSVFEPRESLAAVIEAFPAALQLLPPRGSGALSRAGSPGERVNPFGSAEALLAGNPVAGAQGDLPAALLQRAARTNASLHDALARGFHPGLDRELAFASAAHPTYCELRLGRAPSGSSWSELAPTAHGGDGLVPVVGAVAHPAMRYFLGQSRHLDLASDPALVGRIDAFLTGPLV